MDLTHGHEALHCRCSTVRWLVPSRKRDPKSLTGLAELSGRKVPNLSRTLRLMADYGLVALQRNIRDVQPAVLATEF